MLLQTLVAKISNTQHCYSAAVAAEEEEEAEFYKTPVQMT